MSSKSRRQNFTTTDMKQFIKLIKQQEVENNCTVPVNSCDNRKLKRKNCHKYYNVNTSSICRKGHLYGCREDSNAYTDNRNLQMMCNHQININKANREPSQRVSSSQPSQPVSSSLSKSRYKSRSKSLSKSLSKFGSKLGSSSRSRSRSRSQSK